MGDDEKSRYQVNILLGLSRGTGIVSTDDDFEVDNSSLPDSIETIEDFDALRYETSHIHLNSALFFADEAKRIEDFFVGDDKDDSEASDLRIDARVPIVDRHDIYVIYSVISTVSFLEALINEFYEKHLRIAKGESSDDFEEELEKDTNVSDSRFYKVLRDLNTIENRDFEYEPVLKKYEYLLTFADKENFNRGEEPYQSVSLVQAFRNNLVHAEAEWVRLGEDETFSLGESLEGKFERNPLASDIQLPRQYFSFDCAKWCIESAFEFLQIFYERIGAEVPFHITTQKDNLWEPEPLISVEEIDETEE